jgi:uncharacterized protein involved in exopolysaccharide biosynthesis
MDSTSSEWSVRGLLEVLFRHRGKALCAFVVVLGAMVAWAILAPHSYRSEAKLLVQIGRESVSLDPTAVIGERTLDPRTTWENEVNSELEVLKNADLRRAVVQTLGAATILGRGPAGEPLTEEPSFLERLKGIVRDWLPASGPELDEEDRAQILLESELDIRSVADSSVLKVAYEASTPELAQRVVEVFTDLYLEKHREVHRTAGSLEFFAAEATRLAEELERAEKHLSDVKNEAGVGDLASQRSSLTERAGTVRQAALTAQAAAQAAEATAAAYEQALASGDLAGPITIQETTALRSTSAQVLEQQLDVLRLEEQSLLETFEPDSRAVRAVREKIAMAEELLGRDAPSVTERVEGPNPARAQVFAAFVTERGAATRSRAEAAALEQELVELQREIEALNRTELEIKRSEREITDLEGRYRRARADLEQVRTDRALEDLRISNISVLQPASRPLKSSRLGRTPAVLVGLVLAFASALAAAWVAEFLDGSLRTPADVRAHLGQPAMISMPRRRALRRWRGVALARSDEIALLRDQLLALTDGPASIIGITSACRGEGVSTIAANLAASLARRDQERVLLVDAVLDAPVQHLAFERPLSPGLIEVLQSGDGDPVPAAGVSGLHLITAGKVRGKDRRADLDLAYERLASQIASLALRWRSEYTHVVLDLPPVGRVPSATRLAKACDAVLLVAAADSHRWQVAAHALERLEQVSVGVAGVVLNKRRFPIPGLLYRSL